MSEPFCELAVLRSSFDYSLHQAEVSQLAYLSVHSEITAVGSSGVGAVPELAVEPLCPFVKYVMAFVNLLLLRETYELVLVFFEIIFLNMMVSDSFVN